MQILEFDTVVIGSGLAGLAAAYHSSRFGKVAIVTKSELDTSNSYYAQGGIAAVIDPDDSPKAHIHDTLVAGRGLCDRDAVEILVNEGRERVLRLIELGMEFDRKNGELTLGLEGGHSNRRILHAGGDATGKELTRFMLKKVYDEKNIFSFEYTAAIDLLKQDNCICGVHAFDFKTGGNLIFKTKAVILATGGLSRIFARSTNPHTAMGDGIAMAYFSGAKIADIEFIQFHPSALNIAGAEAFLISEAVRGEGAWLLNENGERFMKEIHPLAELAPRDVVAYSIFREIQKSSSGFVYLSLKHLDAQSIKNRFSHIYLKLQELGLDMAKDLLPVAPAAHYMVGGIRTGLNAETNISGLFVCGEAASTGVMGANRLASNSLLECLVFGKRASEEANRLKKHQESQMPQPEPVFVNPENENSFLLLKNEIAELLTRNVGIVRNKLGLEQALERLNEICRDFSDTQNEYNRIKIKNLAGISRLIANAALIREESRGGHIRDDFPKQSPDFKFHIIQQINSNPYFEPVRN